MDGAVIMSVKAKYQDGSYICSTFGSILNLGSLSIHNFVRTHHVIKLLKKVNQMIIKIKSIFCI